MPAQATVSVSEQLQLLSPAVRAIVQAARRAAKAAAPRGAIEIAYRSRPPRSRSAMWKLVRYEMEGANRYVVAIGAFSDHASLFFPRGRQLEDDAEAGLLEGRGKTFRFIPLRTPADASRASVKKVLRTAFARHRGSGPTRGVPKPHPRPEPRGRAGGHESKVTRIRKRPETIDGYLATVGPDQRAALEKLRKTILSILPDAEECIRYSMPAFRHSGRVVAGFLATRKGCSYFPFSGSTLATLATDVKEYEQTKSALHFDPKRPLPVTLVRNLLKARLAEGDAKRIAKGGRRASTARRSSG